MGLYYGLLASFPGLNKMAFNPFLYEEQRALEIIQKSYFLKFDSPLYQLHSAYDPKIYGDYFALTGTVIQSQIVSSYTMHKIVDLHVIEGDDLSFSHRIIEYNPEPEHTQTNLIRAYKLNQFHHACTQGSANFLETRVKNTAWQLVPFIIHPEDGLIEPFCFEDPYDLFRESEENVLGFCLPSRLSAIEKETLSLFKKQFSGKDKLPLSAFQDEGPALI